MVFKIEFHNFEKIVHIQPKILDKETPLDSPLILPELKTAPHHTLVTLEKQAVVITLTVLASFQIFLL